jgi:hypothetical protein
VAPIVGKWIGSIPASKRAGAVARRCRVGTGAMVPRELRRWRGPRRWLGSGAGALMLASAVRHYAAAVRSGWAPLCSRRPAPYGGPRPGSGVASMSTSSAGVVSAHRRHRARCSDARSDRCRRGLAQARCLARGVRWSACSPMAVAELRLSRSRLWHWCPDAHQRGRGVAPPMAGVGTSGGGVIVILLAVPGLTFLEVDLGGLTSSTSTSSATNPARYRGSLCPFRDLVPASPARLLIWCTRTPVAARSSSRSLSSLSAVPLARPVDSDRRRDPLHCATAGLLSLCGL